MEKKVSFSSGNRKLSGVLISEKENKSGIIFCHGAFEFKENWLDYARRLSKEFACLVFDFTGHGESEGIPGTVDLDIWEEDIKSAIDFMKLENIGIVGWSSGGSAAIMATSEDKRIKCCAVIDATIKLIPPIHERLLYKTISFLGSIKKKITGKPITMNLTGQLRNMRVAVDENVNSSFKKNERLVKILSKAPIPGCIDTVWTDVLNYAKNISVPFLIIHGEEDKLDLPEEAYLLYENLNCEKEIKIIKDSGHAGHLDQKREEIFKLIEEFFLKHLKRANSE